MAMKYAFFALLLTPALALAETIAGNTPIDIDAARLDVDHAHGKATFSGNVRVVQGTLTLTAETLTATYGANGQGDIEEMVASGGVMLMRKGTVEERASGSKAIYDPKKQTLTLTGAVALQRGPSTLAGDKLVYDIANGNAKVTNSNGPVKARFTPATK